MTRECEMQVRITIKEEDNIFQDFQEAERGEVYISEDGYVRGYHFSNQYISNLISKEKLERLTCETPLLVVSQTGTGKSTLVLRNVLPLVKETGKRILILVSRTALAMQYKKEAAALEEPELLENLTTLGLQRHSRFGAVEILTYQCAFYKLRDKKVDFTEYAAVILDECHYFVQDAAFDLFTYHILELIMKRLHHCRRIYLTATPDMVANQIIKMEYANRGKLTRIRWDRSIGGTLLDAKFLIYEFEQNYDYVSPCFFIDDKEIIDIIKADDEKYLVCVDSKERGQKIATELGNETAEYIDAELKNNDKADVVETIIASEKFFKRVLIATSFLDVGVNLKDDKLKKIVIFSTSKTHFLQAIGRKRNTDKERVFLYIKIPRIDSLKQRYARMNLELKDIIKNEEQLKNITDLPITTMPFPFYLQKEYGNNVVKYNGFSFSNLKFRIKEVGKILESAREYESPEEGIAREYLRWLGLEEKFEDCHWLTKKPDSRYQELQLLLEEYSGREMDKEEFDEFKRRLIPLHNKIDSEQEKWYESRLPHVQRINNFLNTCGVVYKIISSSSPTRYYVERG